MFRPIAAVALCLTLASSALAWDPLFSLDDVLDQQVANQVEDSVEQGVESSVTGQVENVIDAEVEGSVEQIAEQQAEDLVVETLSESAEEQAETSVEQAVDSVIQDSVEEQVAESSEQQLEAQVADAVEDSVEAGVDEQVTEIVIDASEERIVLEIEELVGAAESELTRREDYFHLGDWLLLARPEVFDELYREGFIFDDTTELPGLELRMGVATAPASFDIDEARAGVMQVVGGGDIEVDMNHIYTAGVPGASNWAEGLDPGLALPFPALPRGASLRIGMADSSVDLEHPALSDARISAQDFLSTSDGVPPRDHGTAIASILVGRSDVLTGIAPTAELFAAGVFESDGKRGEYASTVNLLRALDWLVRQNVTVINLSLAGPPNRLLEHAINKITGAGVVVVAAAGNGGPMAQPFYPAAYERVVAVTAVDARQRVYRLANRGRYVDVSAPGVDVRHARAGGGYATSSGTSYAVPFAALAAARVKALSPSVDAVNALRSGARDLGDPGFDEIYGYGLLQPEAATANSD